MSAQQARPALTEARRQRRNALPGYIHVMHSLADPQRLAIEAYVAAINREAAAYRVGAREGDAETPSPSGTATGHLANNPKEQHD